MWASTTSPASLSSRQVMVASAWKASARTVRGPTTALTRAHRGGWVLGPQPPAAPRRMLTRPSARSATSGRAAMLGRSGRAARALISSASQAWTAVRQWLMCSPHVCIVLEDAKGDVHGPSRDLEGEQPGSVQALTAFHTAVTLPCGWPQHCCRRLWMRLTYDVVHEVWDVAVDGGHVWQPDRSLAEHLGQRPLQRPRELLHRTALCRKRTCRQLSK